MIVLGVDPGARDTGLAVVDYALGGTPAVLGSWTISRPKSPGDDLLDVPDDYLVAIDRAIGSAQYDDLDEYDGYGRVELIAVEHVRRPAWRVGGKVKPLDPTAIMATAIVLGSVLGKAYGVPVVRVRPAGNGSLFPLTRYPHPLATEGKGKDARRHERSAYDVAVMGATSLPRDRMGR